MTLFLTALSFSANAQYRISFRVVDSAGYPIIGVTAVVAGTTQGAISDIDGYITLDVPSPDTPITISIIGYQSITVKASLLRGTIVLYDENDGYSMRKSPKTQPAKITYSRFIKNE